MKATLIKVTATQTAMREYGDGRNPVSHEAEHPEGIHPRPSCSEM